MVEVYAVAFMADVAPGAVRLARSDTAIAGH